MRFAATPHLPTRLLHSLLAAAVLCGAATSAMAQWKWKDGNGRVQYSDLPPPAGVADRDILQRPGGVSLRASAPAPAAAPAAEAPASVAASAPRATAEPELEAKRRKQEEEAAAKRKAEEDQATAQRNAQRAENCTRAQSHMRALNDGMRLARVNEKGEREVLDDKARAEEVNRTRATIASDCQ